jgi:hypothetical protein
MKRIALALAALSLASCGTLGEVASVASGGPVVVADRVKIDEQVGLTVTLAYTAAARAAAFAISTGLIKDRAQIARIGVLNNRAYQAVLAVRTAYTASNATGYLSALTMARQSVADLLAALKG